MYFLPPVNLQEGNSGSNKVGRVSFHNKSAVGWSGLRWQPPPGRGVALCCLRFRSRKWPFVPRRAQRQKANESHVTQRDTIGGMA